MGKFKVKWRKNELHLVYRLDHFEEMQQTNISGVIELQQHDNQLEKRLVYYETVRSFLEKGVSLMQLKDVLYQVVMISDVLKQQYVELRDVLYYPEQFVVDTQTKRIHFVHIPVTSVMPTLSVSDLICHWLNAVHIHMQDKLTELEQLLTVDKTMAGIKKWCHSFDTAYALTVVDGGEVIRLDTAQIIGQPSFVQTKGDYISREHLSYMMKDNKHYIVDLNTLNGTWLNGEKLVPHKSYVVTEQDDLKIANIVCRLTKIR